MATGPRRTPPRRTPPRPTTWSVVAASLALGCAAGSRSSLGIAGPVLAAPRAGSTTAGSATAGDAVTPRRRVARVGALLAVAGEIVGDKLPEAPSRLDPPGPAVRMASGAVGSVALARGRGAGPAALVAAALAGAAGGAAGAWGGAAWRRTSVGRGPDWPGAVAEDAVALALTAWAVRR